MKLSKCHFLMKKIQYLGHILSTKGIKPQPLKTQAIKNMHPPKHQNKYMHSLDLQDTTGNSSGTLQK